MDLVNKHYYHTRCVNCGANFRLRKYSGSRSYKVLLLRIQIATKCCGNPNHIWCRGGDGREIFLESLPEAFRL